MTSRGGQVSRPPHLYPAIDMRHYIRIMLRLFLLAIPCAILFVGFAMPFIIAGSEGLITAAILILLGSGLLWLIEKKTKRSLEEDTALNKTLNTDA